MQEDSGCHLHEIEKKIAHCTVTKCSTSKGHVIQVDSLQVDLRCAHTSHVVTVRRCECHKTEFTSTFIAPSTLYSTNDSNVHGEARNLTCRKQQQKEYEYVSSRGTRLR